MKMALKKLQLLSLLACALMNCHIDFIAAVENNTTGSNIILYTANRTIEAVPSSNRSLRAIKVFYHDPKELRGSGSPKRYASPSSSIISRSDHFPPHLNFQRRLFAGNTAPRRQMIRRVHNNIPPIRQSYEGFKSSRFSPVKEAALVGGLGPQYRPQFSSSAQSHSHPNGLSPAGAPSQQYIQNFKPSPVFNGKAIVRPVLADQKAQLQHEQYLQQQQQYAQQQQQQKYQQAREQYYVQQQKAKQQLNLREQSPQQYHGSKPLSDQQSGNYKINLPLFSKSAPHNSYSVYEEADLAERAQLQIASARNHDMTAKGAQEYLNFMGSNEYFLPKREPNYKKLDDELDRILYQQRSSFPQAQQQSQQQRQVQYSKPAHDPQRSSSSVAAPTYSKPIEVAQLFYHGDSSPSSTIVRGSYQAGNNVFAVNSDGNKAVKHIVPNPSATTPRAVSSTQRYSSPLNRTPEPIRFEFTERDAISPATYTNAPSIQLRKSGSADTGLYSYSTPATPLSNTTPSLKYGAAKPSNDNRSDTNNDDDPEDEEDMQQASSADSFGRTPVKVQNKVDPDEQPSEQKDTEDYCEKICSNVQDDDEEVVCGSDGYMYTSEAQMECYASCLHIDVTIQGKGSCSAR